MAREASYSKGATPARIMVPRILLIGSALLLCIIGLVMIYSASSITALSDYGDSAYYLKSQLKFFAIGIILAAVAAYVPFEFWHGRVSWGIWGVVVLLLLVTAFMGAAGYGAQRWVSLGPLGGFQPSELAKIAVIILMARIILVYRDSDMPPKMLILFIGIVAAVPCVLILMQPDLGTSAIVAFGALVVLWLGEIDFRPVAAVLVFGVILGIIAILISPYRRKRFVAGFDPWSDPLGDGYQLINSLYAFGSGGIFGVGLGNSHQKYAYLPFAHTDFIFSVIGEELGLVGTIIVVLLFIVFVYAGIQIARQSPTPFGHIIAGAATSVIGIQAFINMASSIGMFPVTGKPMPFVSSGGSSLLVSLMLTGLILSVSFHSHGADAASKRRGDMRIIEGNKHAYAKGRRGGQS